SGTDRRRGEIVTFYSFKGGTGRTMAVANVAWILASAGKRVLAADWDLESPGLHRFLHPFLDAARLSTAGGVIDLIREFEHATGAGEPQDPAWYAHYAEVDRYALPLTWSFGRGRLDVLTAGRQNRDYATHLSDLDWDDFYERRHGGRFFDALREDLRRRYDYVLIDSRTGLSELADICTAHLPDTLVTCFTFAEQAISGAATLAREIASRHRNRAIRVLPAPMHIDRSQAAQAQAGRTVAMRRLAGLPAGLTDAQRRRYWAAVEVPYQPAYAFEEILAAVADPPGVPGTMLSAYLELVRHITNGEVTGPPILDEGVRRRTAARFVRTPDPIVSDVTLQYTPVDAVWGEWVASICRGAGLVVADPWLDGFDPPPGAARLTLVSSANAAALARLTHDERAQPGGPPLAAYIADVTPVSSFDAAHSAQLHSGDVVAATTNLLTLLGHASTVLDGPHPPTRFPGRPPAVFQAPSRDPRFTGRGQEMRELRDRLRDQEGTALLPGGSRVAVLGMGGIGKSQIAIEYAHRYAAAYDLVWWIDATGDVTEQLAALAPHLAVKRPSPAAAARAALAALERGRMYADWLVIFDGADDFDAVAGLLPRGFGHTLVTSRDPAWAEHAEPLEVGLFDRAESIAHLRHRLPTIRDSEAVQVAASVADLPVAVAAAGRWLADTGRPPAELLVEPERIGSRLRWWNTSLDRVRAEAAAAYRLLEVCSVLGPEIGLSIVYSDALAAALAEVDPAVVDRWRRGKLVQTLTRLALIQLDVRGPEAGGARVVIHPVLQQVIRSRMSEPELAVIRHHAHVVLASIRPPAEVDDPRGWGAYAELWPHLDASGAAECTDAAVRQLLLHRLRHLRRRGQYAEGRRLGDRLEQSWTERLAFLAEPDAAELRRQLAYLKFQVASFPEG
ncbi:MAG: hypothetical protein HOV77_04590, partial [Hamadaea sp.]|uniref:FxSxx-COOH system tetratricopeptide repeat protein n=1 Tax=Hamadaea sp. TaxID=2024425 RepID=UPI0018101A42